MHKWINYFFVYEFAVHITMPSRPKQVGVLTYKSKKKVCQWYDANSTLTQSQLVDNAKGKFGVFKAPVQGTISGILGDLQKLLHVMDLDSRVSGPEFSRFLQSMKPFRLGCCSVNTSV